MGGIGPRTPSSLFEVEGSDPEYEDARRDLPTRAYVDLGLWSSYRMRADPGFPARIRTRFLETFSEMFAACHLMDCGWTIEKDTGAGPDVKASRDGVSMVVEVTMPEAGSGKGSVPPPVWMPRNRGDGIVATTSGTVPVAEMDSRFVKAIETKASQRREHERAGKVDAESAAVLFVNMGRAGGGYVPHDLALNVLLGVRVRGETPDGLAYGTGHFLRDEYRWLSAVAVARVTAWSAAKSCHEIVLMHNPNATVPMPEGSWGSRSVVREITAKDCAAILAG